MIPATGIAQSAITVTDPSGDSATATSTVNVDPVNDAPALDLNGAAAGTISARPTPKTERRSASPTARWT